MSRNRRNRNFLPGRNRNRMYSSFGTGFGSGSDIKCNTKVKKSKIRGQLSGKKMLLLALKRQGFLQINCCWKLLGSWSAFVWREFLDFSEQGTCFVPDISVADPGWLSRILIFTHPGSRISDPGSKNSIKREGWKKIWCHNFLCSHKFHIIVHYFSLKCWRKKFGPNFQRIIELFTQKIVTKLSKVWVWDPRSGIRKKPIPDPGSWGQKGTGSRILGSKRHRIPDPDPQHCLIYLLGHFWYGRRVCTPASMRRQWRNCWIRSQRAVESSGSINISSSSSSLSRSDMCPLTVVAIFLHIE